MMAGLICGAGMVLSAITILGVGYFLDNSLDIRDVDKIIKRAKEVKSEVEENIVIYEDIDQSRNTVIDLKRHNSVLVNDINYLELLCKFIIDGGVVRESEEPELQNILDHISSAKSYLSHL